MTKSISNATLKRDTNISFVERLETKTFRAGAAEAMMALAVHLVMCRIAFGVWVGYSSRLRGKLRYISFTFSVVVHAFKCAFVPWF